jgi:hypothetical protein
MLQGAAFTGGCSNCFAYWVDHIYDRAVMGLPTGAMLGILSKRWALCEFSHVYHMVLMRRSTTMSSVAGLLMFLSIFVGWGTYMSLGWDITVES